MHSCAIRPWPRESGYKQQVLVVEEEYFLADDCASVLRKARLEIAGSVGTLEEGLALLDEVGAALVDINLGGTPETSNLLGLFVVR
jgi:hypothetical protein